MNYEMFTNYYGGISSSKVAREYAGREKDPEYKAMFLKLAEELDNGVKYVSFINENGQLTYKK